MFINLLIISVLHTSVIESTDLAAVYKHGILHLERVDEPSATYTIDENFSLYFNVTELLFPVALTYDPLSQCMFVTDLNDYNADVYALPNGTSKAPLKTIIHKSGSSSIESLSYNPIDQVLYWSDSHKNGIYSKQINEGLNHSSFKLIDSSVHKPRGITIDYCNRHLFWSERDPEHRRITFHNLNDGTNKIIVEATSDIYYQAVAYDTREGQLVWAETVGDHAGNSSCNIVKYNLKSSEMELFATFKKCYPFSLTLDENYFYWSDWATKGIMRLSKQDPNDVVLLLNTSPVRTKEGEHNGAFGLAILEDFDPSICHEHLAMDEISAESMDLSPSYQAEPAQLSGASFDPFTQMKSMYHRLRYMFVASLCIGCFFMFSTFYLIVRAKFFPGINQAPNDQPTIPKIENILATNRRKHRRFGPSYQPSCMNRISDDGVMINIEDCCQMTLCDTPCYTSLKKEGKSYLHGQKTSAKKICSEDKKILLEEDNLSLT